MGKNWHGRLSHTKNFDSWLRYNHPERQTERRERERERERERGRLLTTYLMLRKDTEVVKLCDGRIGSGVRFPQVFMHQER